MSDLNNRALVVEDEATISRPTMRALSRGAFKCNFTAYGDAEIKLTITTNVAVVVTDLKMPKWTTTQSAANGTE